ncbi:hypothetical protein [Fodinicola feengrottensis]|uniref:hypothetical protein n=1 Tax=Fodinicola feengrottensis TaxID=435914 RepID=UPI0013D6D960|nr:hypothetical protein [Fodinicola feengrottensis]
MVDNKLDPAHPDFPLAGAHPDQVDSFWLHLTVETGLLGLAFYLLWLYFLIFPRSYGHGSATRCCDRGLRHSSRPPW